MFEQLFLGVATPSGKLTALIRFKVSGHLMIRALGNL
jgi:hypothetical protein